VGLTFSNDWNGVTHYTANQAVTYGGSTYIALASNTDQEPDTSPQAWSVLAQAGSTGQTGEAGTAATVTIGTVTTLAAGSPATVSNTGSESAAVLNFGIPQGAQGAAGSGGTAGVSSGDFAAMYHSVSYTTTYYAVNTTQASASENATVLAWVPQGCTVTRLDVNSQQSGSITVTLRSGASPATMAPTSVSCSPGATTGGCPALGSFTIPAGDFIDFEISGASGTPAGVWTALQCQ
jgi:hypothetical protein